MSRRAFFRGKFSRLIVSFLDSNSRVGAQWLGKTMDLFRFRPGETDGPAAKRLRAAAEKHSMIPVCHRWHVNPNYLVGIRSRCDVCGFFQRSARSCAKCQFDVQHTLGVAVQVRTDLECLVMCEALFEALDGSMDLVRVVVDYEHGGTPEARGRLASLVVGRLRKRIRDAFDACDSSKLLL